MKKIFVAMFVLVMMVHNSLATVSEVSKEVSDPNLKISIGGEAFGASDRVYPTVTLENSIQKIVIRTQSGGKNTGGVESVIKDWILKSNGKDVVSKFVDANSFRGALSSATVTVDEANNKTIRLKYVLGSIVEYTINARDPVVKVKYEKYDVIPTSNIVDNPSIAGVTKVYGQGGWIRSITSSYYPCAYWDTYEKSLGGCKVKYGPDSTDAGSLNYKGYIIMAHGQTKSDGVGFARVMPIYNGKNGGIKILKIFPWGGFEPYQATARGQSARPPHVGYIYAFQNGVDNAIMQGKQIVDSGK